jgi:hypothetical protein
MILQTGWLVVGEMFWQGDQRIKKWRPVQEDSPISDITPISKPIIYGEHIITSDHKKAAPSIEGHSPFHEPTKQREWWLKKCSLL